MTSLRILLTSLLTVTMLGCASRAEREREDREDARKELEEARRDGERRAAEYVEFLNGYARGLGKTPAQLSAAERADAHKVFDR